MRDRKAQRRRPPQKIVRLQQAPTGASTSQGSAIDPADSELSPSQNVQADEQARRVRDRLARLPDPTDREIVRLRFFEGLSLRQIADRLQLSYDQVRDRYQHSMRRLERDLGGQP